VKASDLNAEDAKDAEEIRLRGNSGSFKCVVFRHGDTKDGEMTKTKENSSSSMCSVK
jgi:hypothetical protein